MSCLSAICYWSNKVDLLKMGTFIQYNLEKHAKWWKSTQRSQPIVERHPSQHCMAVRDRGSFISVRNAQETARCEFLMLLTHLTKGTSGIMLNCFMSCSLSGPNAGEPCFCAVQVRNAAACSCCCHWCCCTDFNDCKMSCGVAWNALVEPSIADVSFRVSVAWQDQESHKIHDMIGCILGLYPRVYHRMPMMSVCLMESITLLLSTAQA